MRIKLDNTLAYYSSTSTKKKKNLGVNTTSIPSTLLTLKHVEKFKKRNLKKIAYQLT